MFPPSRIRINGSLPYIGYLINNYILYVKRNPKKHLYRSEGFSVSEARRTGTAFWGLDCKVCHRLIAKNFTYLVISTPTGTYMADLIKFLETDLLKDFGFGVQYFLNEREFEKISNGHLTTQEVSKLSVPKSPTKKQSR